MRTMAFSATVSSNPECRAERTLCEWRRTSVVAGQPVAVPHRLAAAVRAPVRDEAQQLRLREAHRRARALAGGQPAQHRAAHHRVLLPRGRARAHRAVLPHLHTVHVACSSPSMGQHTTASSFARGRAGAHRAVLPYLRVCMSPSSVLIMESHAANGGASAPPHMRP